MDTIDGNNNNNSNANDRIDFNEQFNPLDIKDDKLTFIFERYLDNTPLDHHPVYNTMCKHWLRGLCKKGFNCEYLHIYDMSKMPYCHFYQRGTKPFLIQLISLGECQDPECVFLHKTEEKEECPWYSHIGFCRYGPKCVRRHNRKALCANYLRGFCPDGLKCSFGHPNMLKAKKLTLQQKNKHKVIT